jgi:hypothetical protein
LSAPRGRSGPGGWGQCRLGKSLYLARQPTRHARPSIRLRPRHRMQLIKQQADKRRNPTTPPRGAAAIRGLPGNCDPTITAVCPISSPTGQTGATHPFLPLSPRHRSARPTPPLPACRHASHDRMTVGAGRSRSRAARQIGPSLLCQPRSPQSRPIESGRIGSSELQYSRPTVSGPCLDIERQRPPLRRVCAKPGAAARSSHTTSHVARHGVPLRRRADGPIRLDSQALAPFSRERRRRYVGVRRRRRHPRRRLHRLGRQPRHGQDVRRAAICAQHRQRRRVAGRSQACPAPRSGGLPEVGRGWR